MKNILNGDYSVLPENQAYNRFGSIRIKKDFYENHLKNNLKELIGEINKYKFLPIFLK